MKKTLMVIGGLVLGVAAIFGTVYAVLFFLKRREIEDSCCIIDEDICGYCDDDDFDEFDDDCDDCCDDCDSDDDEDEDEQVDEEDQE